MQTKVKRIRFHTITKNPLSQKLKEKQAKIFENRRKSFSQLSFPNRLYQNYLKNRDFDKEAPQNFDPELSDHCREARRE